MADLLRSCDELQAYTLSDRATFDQLSERLDLGIEHQGDPTLRNVYALTLMRRRNARGYATAQKFAQWLLSERGGRVVESFTIHGHRESFWLLIGIFRPAPQFFTSARNPCSSNP